MTPKLISCCLHTSLSSPELPKGERHRHIKDDLNPFRQEGCRLNPVEASRSNSRGGFQRVMAGIPIRRHFFWNMRGCPSRERFPGEREAIIQAINSRVRFNRSHNSIRFLIYIDASLNNIVPIILCRVNYIFNSLWTLEISVLCVSRR